MTTTDTRLASLTDKRDPSRKLEIDMTRWLEAPGGTGMQHVFVEMVRQHMGGYLWHRTDEANLDFIAKHGLLSRDERARRGIEPQHLGGDGLTSTLDTDYGLNDYVFVGLTGQGLMPKHKDRTRRPAWLRVLPEVLLTGGVVVAKGCANHRGTERYSVAEAVEKLDWDLYFWGEGDDVGDKARRNCFFDTEILVPNNVHPDYLTRAPSPPV